MDRNYSLILVGGGIEDMTISIEAAISKKFKNQFHILNSPAWTSSLKTAKFIIYKILD